MDSNNTNLVSTFLSQLHTQWKICSMTGTAHFALRKAEQDLDQTLAAALDPIELQRGQGFTNITRRIQWAEGRRCLQIMKNNKNDIKNLTNLSHSGTWVIALGVDSHSKILGVGVDIEPKLKQLPSNAVEFLVSTQEQNLFIEGVNLLNFWLIKEACFKSDPQPSSSTFLDYQIVSFDFEKQCGKVIGRNGLTFLFFLTEFDDYRISFAQSLTF